MKIGMIGAGNVGGALTRASTRAGHAVTVTASDPLVILAVPFDAVEAS